LEDELVALVLERSRILAKLLERCDLAVQGGDLRGDLVDLLHRLRDVYVQVLLD
jgi:hypothetical protein